MKLALAILALALSAGAASAQYFGNSNRGSTYGGSTYGGGMSGTGSYVGGYQQTNPNNTQLDNYGTRGNYNPYSGTFGTRGARY